MPEDIQHPINAFPEYLQEIIAHYSETKGYPTEFFIAAMLAAVSTASGRSVTLNTGAYTAIGSVWIIILNLRGKVKSPPLDDAFEPLQNEQFKIISQYRNEVDELEQYKADNPKAKVKEIPNFKKILINDTTPEKLVISMAENPKGLGIVYDELSGFIRRFNRYSSGADEEMYLSLFNGNSVMRDRVNGNSNAYVRRSFLSIVGTTQPSVLKEVFTDKSENGFFDRWLICNPKTVVKQYPNHYGVDPVVSGKYANIISTLSALEYLEAHYNQMSYSEDSYKIIFDYQCSLIDIQNETENGELRGILAKVEIYVHRFALLLQMIKYGISENIQDVYLVSTDAAKGAVILAKYFTDQAQQVRILTPVDKLNDKWLQVYNSLPSHGVKFDRKQFIKHAAVQGLKERAADNFLKEHGLRSDGSLLFKIAHGVYTKNLF